MGKIVVATSDDFREALEAYRQYVAETGKYARIVHQKPERKEVRKYVVYGYDEECRLGKYIKATHMDLTSLAKHYITLTKMKVATERLLELTLSDTIRLALEEKKYLKESLKMLEPHPIYKWCTCVKAGKGTLGVVDALMFLGFIDPHEATTGAKAKAFWGLTPQAKLEASKKISARVELKGIAYMIAKRVIMGKDPYYYALYDAKKRFLMNKYPDKLVFKRGNKVTVYEKGKPGYAAGINGKAMFWLMQLLVSHAQEIIRTAEGYEVPKHYYHIPPKPLDIDAEPEPSLVEIVEKGLSKIR
ncbi:MAG: hypothetical protein QXT92_00090 [Nitrososphaerota archaeon]